MPLFKPKADSDIDISIQSTEDKKRHKKWRLLEINVLTLSVIFALLTLFMIFGKRPTTSYEENRDLTECPKFSVSSYLDGTFTSQFSKFFNDTVPMRSTFKSMISGFRAHLGIPYAEATLVGYVPTGDEKTPIIDTTSPVTVTEPETTSDMSAVPDISDTETSAPEPETVPEATEMPTEAEPEDDGEIANNILIVKNRGIMLFGGSYSGGESYAETMNAYKKALGESVNVYSLTAPTAVSFYLPKKFANASSSETEHIDHINSFLSGVTPVDAFAALEPHKDEAIYSRTDHHWQPLGAYYAAEAFAQTAGVPFAPLSDYETVVKEGYVGTLYGYTGSQAIKDNPEDFIYYKPTNNITTTYYDTDMTNEREAPLMLNLDNVEPSSWYLVFMGGDERITHVETDCHNGRKLCIIKDSYGNALVPCLTSSFEEIWVIDMRYFQPNAITFMQEHGVTDLLFAMNTYSATGSNANKARTIMEQ